MTSSPRIQVAICIGLSWLIAAVLTLTMAGVGYGTLLVPSAGGAVAAVAAVDLLIAMIAIEFISGAVILSAALSLLVPLIAGALLGMSGLLAVLMSFPAALLFVGLMLFANGLAKSRRARRIRIEAGEIGLPVSPTVQANPPIENTEAGWRAIATWVAVLVALALFFAVMKSIGQMRIG